MHPLSHLHSAWLWVLRKPTDLAIRHGLPTNLRDVGLVLEPSTCVTIRANYRFSPSRRRCHRVPIDRLSCMQENGAQNFTAFVRFTVFGREQSSRASTSYSSELLIRNQLIAPNRITAWAKAAVTCECLMKGRLGQRSLGYKPVHLGANCRFNRRSPL